MYIAILGRQPALSIAELERVYSDVQWFSDSSALVESDSFDIERLGGTQKAGKIIFDISSGDWRRVSTQIITHYSKAWAKNDGKVTLGISVYGFAVSSRDVQQTGIILKSKLKQTGTSLRLVPNITAILNSATSHHNKLGLSPNKVELLIVRGSDGKIVIAESTGAQNITALAARDQGRPKRDAFVGMLPPKLAQIMINLAGANKSGTLWDAFCGTGVILQEAMLMDIDVYGSDVSEKMIAYSKENIDWLHEKYATYSLGQALLKVGDATEIQFENKHTKPLQTIVAETYLGQPFSAPPSPSKLVEVRGNCNHIISGFLKNIAPQIAFGTQLCIAIPAWKDTFGNFTHLPLIDNLEKLGYTRVEFKTISDSQLLYHRDDQVVARELLVLTRI